jgi:hypothetical protein
LRREFSNRPRESANSRFGRDFANQFVEMVVKIRTAVEDAAGLRHKKWFAPQIQTLNHVLDETREIFGRATQKSSSGLITFIRGFRNDWENFGKNAVRIGANLILQLDPITFEESENFISQIRLLTFQGTPPLHDDSFSSDIISAPRITENGTEASFTRESTGDISANRNRTSASDD